MSTIEFQTPITLPGRLPSLANTGWPRVLIEPFHWLTRPRRILLILSSVWVINLFDLSYTLGESLHISFRELNPLAAFLIGKNPDLLIGYKLGLLSVSSAILLTFRRQRISELGCWFLFIVYLYVALRWCVYFEHRFALFADPAVNIDPILGRSIP